MAKPAAVIPQPPPPFAIPWQAPYLLPPPGQAQDFNAGFFRGGRSPFRGRGRSRGGYRGAHRNSRDSPPRTAIPTPTVSQPEHAPETVPETAGDRQLTVYSDLDAPPVEADAAIGAFREALGTGAPTS